MTNGLTYGMQLKIARIENELTQKKLAARTGITMATIGDIESGGNCKITTFIF